MYLPSLGGFGFPCWRPDGQKSTEPGTLRGCGSGDIWKLGCLVSEFMPGTSHSVHSSRTSVMVQFLRATVTFIYIFAGDLLISVPPVSVCWRPWIVEFVLQSGEKWREQMGLWLILWCWIYKKIFCQTLHSSLWDEIDPMNKIANLTQNRCFI